MTTPYLSAAHETLQHLPRPVDDLARDTLQQHVSRLETELEDLRASIPEQITAAVAEHERRFTLSGLLLGSVAVMAVVIAW